MVAEGVETAKNAARERNRVKSLKEGFQRLQSSLPSVPRDTKLSKLDVLFLAINYIRYLNKILEEDGSAPNKQSLILNGDVTDPKYLHPVKVSVLYFKATVRNDTILEMADEISSLRRTRTA